MSAREHFIPLSRQDVRHLCTEAYATEDFDAFADLLSAYIHHQYHQQLETLKSHFAPWDPDRDTQPLKPRTQASESSQQPAQQPTQQPDHETALITQVKQVLTQANYRPLSDTQLHKALAEDALLSLDMSIDFADFAHCLVYWRGESREAAPEPVHSWWYRLKSKWKRPEPELIDVFQRMVLLLRFQEADYFEAQGRPCDKLSFTPGKMYVYLYKSIPQRDVEVLFPNVSIRMTWKDRLLFILPALGAAVPMVLKALPQLLLLWGVLLFVFSGPQSAERLGIQGEQIQQFLPVMVALLSLGVMFGGFAVKQYLSYKNKRLRFLKEVTDTLFFKNLVCNRGVFHSLIDEAEEEVSKEALLVLTVLWQHPQGLSAKVLDDTIEAWLASQGLKVDFHVEKALQWLSQIRHGDQSLVFENTHIWQALPLSQACYLVDALWDNLYPFANTPTPPSTHAEKPA